MWPKCLAIFCGFSLIAVIFNAILFWILDGLKTKTLLGFHFLSSSSLIIFAVLLSAPLILTMNYAVISWYSAGIGWLKDGVERIWPIQLLSWAAGPVAFCILCYLWRRELPSRGEIICLLFYTAGYTLKLILK